MLKNKIRKIAQHYFNRSNRWKNSFDSERRATSYDKLINIFALRREERLRVLGAILPETSAPVFKILELGAGTGIITELLVSRYPKASIIAVEGAENMMAKAKTKGLLQKNDHRIQWVFADFSSPSWQKQVSGPFHLVVTMDSLHHLDHSRTKELYEEIYSTIQPGGYFFFSDHITSGHIFHKDPQYTLWMDEILENVKQVELNSDIAIELEKAYGMPLIKIQEQFPAKWRKDFTAGLNREGENPMSLMSHVEVMNDAGFSDLMIEYRYANFAVISARKF